ncbi:hypothetical protein CEUSTIGMA_g4642.t1 [Chlamydomonas eustigma]|uniref:Uncharacterized protein n=1 Tax=Chlamydomonas eustigma TaxID=1157962 RepID=A0A250X2B8_9CHLO|nr:hypothetical protein CEUSTIGMA_g4642.t1 [Chlamydomonas eustigma]|eukprot:GAX77196.1 hypothetical protein CEUSTIGMA_g4642.t1 [Chlamydomonas eustigma]
MPVQKLPNVDEVAWRRFLESFVDELSRLQMLTKSQQQQQQDCAPPTAADVKLESELFPMAGTLPDEQSTYTASPPTSFWSSLGHLENSSHDPILDCSLDFLSDSGLA